MTPLWLGLAALAAALPAWAIGVISFLRVFQTQSRTMQEVPDDGKEDPT
jgi:hypothetical protein